MALAGAAAAPAQRDSAAAAASLLGALQQFGPAPGARELMARELAAAQAALASGVYVVWRSNTGGDCTRQAARRAHALGWRCLNVLCCAMRVWLHAMCVAGAALPARCRVGPASLCFCGHALPSHAVDLQRHEARCGECACRRFEYVPVRPEEVGEWWLPRRPGFDVRQWRAKCKCSHAAGEHAPPFGLACRVCRCARFTSAFRCVACDRAWDDHETARTPIVRTGGAPGRSCALCMLCRCGRARRNGRAPGGPWVRPSCLSPRRPPLPARCSGRRLRPLPLRRRRSALPGQEDRLPAGARRAVGEGRMQDNESARTRTERPELVRDALGCYALRLT